MIEIVIACSGAVISFIALWISIYQIHLSNKHHLFDRRFKIYTVLDDFISGYLEFKSSKLTPLLGNYPSEELHLDFLKLTSVRSLKSVSDALIAFDQFMDIKLMMKKLEEFESYGREAKIVFKKKLGKQVSYFIENYSNVLVSLTFYQNHLADCCQKSYAIREQTGTIGNFSIEDKENEKDFREKVYFAYKELDRAYKVIMEEKIMEAIKKTLKLW